MVPSYFSRNYHHAIFDAKKWQNYFSLPNIYRKEVKPIIIEVTEKTKAVKISHINSLYGLLTESNPTRGWNVFHIDNPFISNESFNIAFNLIKHFDEIEENTQERFTSGKGAVLVFVPGYDDINEMLKLLSSDKRSSSHWLILPLHSSITLEEQRKLFETSKIGERKITLATNIAESSTTVPDIE